MTAPFAPPLPWEVKSIVLGLLAFVVAIPFARRTDGVGWIAFATLAAVAVGLWALMIRGMALNAIRWWRGRSGSV